MGGGGGEERRGEGVERKGEGSAHKNISVLQTASLFVYLLARTEIYQPCNLRDSGTPDIITSIYLQLPQIISVLLCTSCFLTYCSPVGGR